MNPSDKNRLRVQEMDARFQADWNRRVYPHDEAATIAAQHCDEARNLAYALAKELDASASSAIAPNFEEVYAANGKVSYEEVEHSRPITCQRNCRMPSSPIWWTFGENHGNADHGFTHMLKILNGKRVRITISLHKEDFPPESASTDGGGA